MIAGLSLGWECLFGIGAEPMFALPEREGFKAPVGFSSLSVIGAGAAAAVFLEIELVAGLLSDSIAVDVEGLIDSRCSLSLLVSPHNFLFTRVGLDLGFSSTGSTGKMERMSLCPLRVVPSE